LNRQLIQLNDPIANAKGRIETISHNRLRGWFYAPDVIDTEIVLTVNGEYKETTLPTIRRPVIQSKLKTGENCGFEFNLKHLDRNRINVITVYESVTGYNFNTERLKYCPLIEGFTDTLKEIFFPEYYRHRHQLENMSNDEAFRHYVEIGVYEDYNPNPWFCSGYFRKNYPHKLKNIELPILSYLNFESKHKVKASEQFDPCYYHATNPDLSHEPSLLRHYVNWGHAEGRQAANRTLPRDISAEVKALSNIEPELSQFTETSRSIVEYPTLTAATYLPRLLKRKFGEEISVVICVPYLHCGGADLISTYVLKAYQQYYGKAQVLLIITDRTDNEMPHWIETGTNVVYLDNEAKFRDFEEKVNTLHSTIGLLSPQKIVNINSHAAWEMYRRFSRQLASVIDLYAYLFCFDYTQENQLTGYIKSFIPKTVRYLKRVFCDNRTIIDDMQKLYGFSPDNMDVFRTLYVPLSSDLKRTTEVGQRVFQKKILWVSRLARQKRPELLVSIARSLPEQEFVVYGPEGDSQANADIVNGNIRNINYRGVFKNLDELNFDEFSLFLNTSAWDGLPTILIQLMGAGVPIVTSNVGGINELVSEDTGWLVEDDDDVAAYCATLKRVLINNNEMSKKIRNGFELIERRHTWASFYKRMSAIGAFDSLEKSERRSIPGIDRRRYRD